MENRNHDFDEKWIRIEEDKMPEGSKASNFVVMDFIHNADDGTKVKLEDEDYIFEIKFDGVPIMSRIADEVTRMRSWYKVQTKYDDEKFFVGHFFYRVEDSKLVDWLVEESEGVNRKYGMTHYCVITADDIIDIVATFPPEIKVYKIPS